MTVGDSSLPSRSVILRIPPFIYGAASAALSLVLLAPAVALGATGSGEDTPLRLPADDGAKQVHGASGSGSLVRTFVGLAIVLFVIYGIAWVLKQVKRSKEDRGHGTSLETTAVVALGPNRSLHLVRAGRELVLVGVAEHGVTPIRTYTEEEAIELGLVSEDDSELDGTPHAPASRAGAVRWLDRLKDRTVRR
jgi:flagellar protein FliO/FliZ